MCGDMTPRASRGGLIAAISPYQDIKPSSSPELVLSFSNAENSHHTHATLSTSDQTSLHALRNMTTFTMRIELVWPQCLQLKSAFTYFFPSRKYGNLMTPTDLENSKPLYFFELCPQYKSTERIEFHLPHRLDFGVSESGIVGRQATLLSSSRDMSEMSILGKGVIGWDWLMVRWSWYTQFWCV